MKLQKKIEEIKFTDCDVWGTVMPVSENIVMASAAGWYVGSVCKDRCSTQFRKTIEQRLRLVPINLSNCACIQDDERHPKMSRHE